MSRVPEIIRKHETDILQNWMKEMSTATRRTDLMNDRDLLSQSSVLLSLLVEGMRSGSVNEVRGQEWSRLRDQLAEISRARAQQGFSPSEVAAYVLSLKRPIFSVLRAELTNPQELADESWGIGELIDRLGIYTTEIFQKSREEVIARQQQEMLELSTPVVKLWDGVLALPLIGTLDSARTQIVMESLLQRIVETGSEVAIIDITGVPTVDTLVAQHLIKTVTAARLMGADCIISGIRPQTAQTIVHLGVDLADVATKATLADAFRVALARTGNSIGTFGKKKKNGKRA
ncbi:anti-sigma-factor antagonist [Candidatus Koribacter versatilis Ellin345]|uniref:Anti-sigma-factor antagonist n=1 Tax=Koribacter versatilis (strain Ellin345) TaxID=204669 RepID=Q1INY3_KORVE|nr:STAS domain-containing protein [Candidatus Koribacter versatilis]ABF41417.1 anti-sigma-factor antagonist [Candidatus Koribacter versatilis Ellin345]